MICDNLKINNKGNLEFAGFDTTYLANKYGTPAYFLDENKIREKCKIYINAMHKYFGDQSTPLFASKALCFKRIYEIMNEENMGIDVVSSGEIYTALKAGFNLQKAYFHGNNKTNNDISYAMNNNIGYFVCDNFDEIDCINEQAKNKGIKQKILLRLTPGIDPHTHQKISTGNIDSKFGIAIETGQALDATKYVLSKENIILEGFHCHIGSQIFEVEPYINAAKIMIKFMSDVNKTLGFNTKILNLGGGMAVRYIDSDPSINYEENIKNISITIKKECKNNNIPLPIILMEPGRSIVADAGLTLYTVGGRKEIPGYKNYVSIDGGMPDNPRYALYQSNYTIITANKAKLSNDYKCTIAGRCCESGDLIQENVNIAKPNRGDLIAVLTTGAYNYSMSSNYNAICKPPIIMLQNNEDYVAVERQTFENLISLQK